MEPVEKWTNVNGHNLLQNFYTEPDKFTFIFQVLLLSLFDLISLLIIIPEHITKSFYK